MRVIFLDIDGVLNNREFLRNKPKKIAKTGNKNIDDFQDIAVSNLDVLYSLLEKLPDIRIVITSSWRILDGYDFNQLLRFKGYFNAIGRQDLVDINWVIGQTPHLGSYRGLEVEVWLKCYLDEHATPKESDRYFGEIESFVILDDDDDWGNYKMKDFWYIVSNNTGLNTLDIEYILQKLKKKVNLKKFFRFRNM